jgi:hypothetical protein
MHGPLDVKLTYLINIKNYANTVKEEWKTVLITVTIKVSYSVFWLFEPHLKTAMLKSKLLCPPHQNWTKYVECLWLPRNVKLGFIIEKCAWK